MKKTGAIKFDIIEFPARDGIRDVLKYLGINEEKFIKDPLHELSEFRKHVRGRGTDDCIKLIKMVTHNQDAEFTRQHLQNIHTIAGELVGRYLGYAVRSYVVMGRIDYKKISEMLVKINQMTEDK